MNRSRVAGACDKTFQIPGVIGIVLKDKYSVFTAIQLESSPRKELKNKVRERVPAVLFIENANSRIYSEVVKTLKNDYIMGK